MDFTIECPCGERLRVGAAEAGGTKRCQCGQAVAVPSLSELRRRAGQRCYDVPIADKLKYMFVSGELPSGNLCAQCGAETANVLHCVVVCERPYAKGRGFWGTVLLGLFAPVWLFGMLKRDYQNPEVFGEELVVDAPLPLCCDCALAVDRKEASLRELLSRVALYDQLLQEYPAAEAAVSRKAVAE